MTLHAVYGTPPAELVAVPSGAVQLSPLVAANESMDWDAAGPLASFAMHAPAGTIERRYAMAQGLKALAVGAPFTILAPKDKGGTRLAKELRAFGCTVEDESRRHYRICTGRRPHELVGVEAALTEGSPRFIPETGLWSQPGVFSWNRVDAGSALLLQHLPALSGEGADLGAGLGYLSRQILQSSHVTALHLLELDRRALAMAKKNVDDARAYFHRVDIRLAPPSVAPLDFVVMNPPFHDGGAEDRSLGLTFIQQAAAMLKTGGVCWLVANRHLPYEEVLNAAFRTVTQHVQAEGFKIYEAVK